MVKEPAMPLEVGHRNSDTSNNNSSTVMLWDFVEKFSTSIPTSGNISHRTMNNNNKKKNEGEWEWYKLMMPSSRKDGGQH
ncbi:hypothetical protein V6N12_055574 [Hibiscus sabdariffa]|uniref:Uncharacterized protein n=1 Tax=Hibiscus sabdariffa TaxID=183260 RepID=A0ABR2BU24_9ROSI